MKEIFNDILDKDEQIIKVYKPNKKRAVTISLIFNAIWMAVFGLPEIVLSILGFTGVVAFINDNGTDETISTSIGFLVMGLVIVLVYVFTVIVTIVRYSKTYYAYSNKRIIIRTGFIGADFATLDMDMIGTVTINVGVLDKFIKPNTGTLRFGSTATPLGGTNIKYGGGFIFSGVDDAYATYRELKEVINTHRDTSLRVK
ncbi:MAG: hypothetical protein VB015_02320 [Erysipelotrichaceae bacterium]|nr:hypothetical protein [Erysipelotrichaceae bacterium]